MGRVYDALKRASDAKAGGANHKQNENEKRRNGSGAGANARPAPPATAGGGGDEHPWDSSPLFTRAAHDSASTAHTEERAGSALSGVEASRVAGATLDAAG